MGQHYHTPSTQKSEAIEEEGMEGWLQPQVEEDWSKTMSTGYDRIHHAYLRLHRQLMSAGGGSQFGFLGGGWGCNRKASSRSTIYKWMAHTLEYMGSDNWTWSIFFKEDMKLRMGRGCSCIWKEFVGGWSKYSLCIYEIIKELIKIYFQNNYNNYIITSSNECKDVCWEAYKQQLMYREKEVAIAS